MSTRSDAVWARFDALTDQISPSPWDHTAHPPKYCPDLALLRSLLGVPITLGASIQSGLHAKAVDVWLASELRRAGFGEDEVWPRRLPPRVLPREVALLLSSLPTDLRDEVAHHLLDRPSGVVSSDAVILGRAYTKQVDVGISQWARGPEIMISTKRMHSSLSNNALNRIEESYGDAHNLRGRHPLAAIGYVLFIRGSAITASPGAATRLIDLVGKLGSDPAGYDATSVIVGDWDEPQNQAADGLVTLSDDLVPRTLRIAHFLQSMVRTVLLRTPVDAHVRARELLAGNTLGFSQIGDDLAPR